MKKTTSRKRLAMHRETVRRLDGASLTLAAGAWPFKTIDSYCDLMCWSDGQGCTAPSAFC